MKITVYELLGLIKDGKAPKKIMYNNIVWEYVNSEQDYRSRHNAELFFNDEINNTWILAHLNTQIEILEEEKTEITEEQIESFKEQFNIVWNSIISVLGGVLKALKVIDEETLTIKISRKDD